MSNESQDLESDLPEFGISEVSLPSTLDRQSDDDISWWPDLPDVDRLNVLAVSS